MTAGLYHGISCSAAYSVAGGHEEEHADRLERRTRKTGISGRRATCMARAPLPLLLAGPKEGTA